MFSFFHPDGALPSDGEKEFIEHQKAAFMTLGCDQTVGASIAEYFTADPTVLSWRQELSRMLIASPEFRQDLSSLRGMLEDFSENLNYLHKIGESPESKLRSLLIAGDYLKIVRSLSEMLNHYDGENAPRSVRMLAKALREEFSSNEFARFEQELSRFNGVLDHVKSITVGVNLDAELRPKEAGVLSINDRVFKSGNRADRFLRLEFKRDEYCTIAPLTSATRNLSYRDRFLFDSAVNNALDRVLKETASYSIKQTATIIRGRMTPYLAILGELQALEPVLTYIQKMQDAGLPLCVADHTDKGCPSFEGLYDPRLCDKLGGRLTANNLTLEDHRKTVILTGPNSGGKTVFWRALATATLFASLGIPISAKSAQLGRIPTVYVAFSPENAKEDRGRLEQECAELGKIVQNCVGLSEIYLDEPFSTTSNEDAAALLSEFTDKLRQKDGTRLILTTHCREYAKDRLKDEKSLCLCLGSGAGRYTVIPDAVSEDSLAKAISDRYW